MDGHPLVAEPHTIMMPRRASPEHVRIGNTGIGKGVKKNVNTSIYCPCMQDVMIAENQDVRGLLSCGKNVVYEGLTRLPTEYSALYDQNNDYY